MQSSGPGAQQPNLLHPSNNAPDAVLAAQCGVRLHSAALLAWHTCTAPTHGARSRGRSGSRWRRRPLPCAAFQTVGPRRAPPAQPGGLRLTRNRPLPALSWCSRLWVRWAARLAGTLPYHCGSGRRGQTGGMRARSMSNQTSWRRTACHNSPHNQCCHSACLPAGQPACLKLNVLMMHCCRPKCVVSRRPPQTLPPGAQLAGNPSCQPGGPRCARCGAAGPAAAPPAEGAPLRRQLGLHALKQPLHCCQLLQQLLVPVRQPPLQRLPAATRGKTAAVGNR